MLVLNTTSPNVSPRPAKTRPGKYVPSSSTSRPFMRSFPDATCLFGVQCFGLDFYVNKPVLFDISAENRPRQTPRHGKAPRLHTNQPSIHPAGAYPAKRLRVYNWIFVSLTHNLSTKNLSPTEDSRVGPSATGKLGGKRPKVYFFQMSIDLGLGGEYRERTRLHAERT